MNISVLSLLGSAPYREIPSHFQTAWAIRKSLCPEIEYVFKVVNRKLQRRWEAYQQTLECKDIEQHYHGTRLKCDILNNKRLCQDKSCSICNIAQKGFDKEKIGSNIDFQRFGHGIYLAPNSSKCHDYTQGSHGCRAMLLCDVCPGKKCHLFNRSSRLPPGYDSFYGMVGGELNYKEITVFNPDAILPRYIIVYKRDGIHKIAQ